MIYINVILNLRLKKYYFLQDILSFQYYALVDMFFISNKALDLIL